MTPLEFNFHIYKTTFYGQCWKAKNTKAVIVLAHGMGEHSGRYIHVAKTLNKHDFSVVAFDHFGHGKTTGKRGHNPSFEAVLESVAVTIKKARAFFPNTPIFLYGHSMGGNAVINYVLKKSTHLQGIIVTSPFLKLAFEPLKIKLALGKLLQKIAPSVTLGNEINPNDISREKIEVDKYINDPLIHSKISPNFSLTFIDSGKWAIDNAPKLTIPILLMHGTGDKIIDYRGTQEFANNANKATLKLYENGYHELHNDLCKKEMLEDVINWISSQL